jgi:hypothetical protein
VWFRKTRSSPRLIIVSQDLDIGAAIEHLILIWLNGFEQLGLCQFGAITRE